MTRAMLLGELLPELEGLSADLAITGLVQDSREVKAGDALSKIAALHGVKTKDLMAANNITDANKIRVGQKLAIPGGKAAAKAEPA